MREYLVELRKQQNESQQDVAEALNISRQYYSMIENGDRQKNMDVTLITAIANHFGISAVDIFNYEAANMIEASVGCAEVGDCHTSVSAGSQ